MQSKMANCSLTSSFAGQLRDAEEASIDRLQLALALWCELRLHVALRSTQHDDSVLASMPLFLPPSITCRDRYSAARNTQVNLPPFRPASYPLQAT